MNFYVRTNYGINIGLGHISRISCLLKHLKKKHTCSIFVDQFDNRNLHLINNLQVDSLYIGNKKFRNQLEDAKKFLSKIRKLPKGIVIVDDYRIGFIWEKLISNYCDKIVSIDDFLYKKHYSDILINSKPDFLNLHLDKIKKINKKNCKFLLGPHYAILNNNIKKKTKRNIFKIVFYSGGSGNLNIFKGIIKNIIKKKNIFKSKVIIQIIVGPYSKNISEIVKIAELHKNIRTIFSPKYINNILINSDLLIATAGVVSFEAAFCKIPSLLFQINKNQETDFLSMQLLGHYLILKKTDLKKIKKISNLIFLLIKNYKRTKKLSQNPKFEIDGKGAQRIAEIISSKKKYNNIFKQSFINNKIKQKEISVKKIDDREINFYLESRNLNINVENSASKNEIACLDHYIWWFSDKKRKSYLITKNNQKLLYVYESCFSYIKNNYVYPGYIACRKDLSVLDILWGLNWQKRNIDKKYKNYICIISTNKKNKFSNQHTKYLGYRPLKEDFKNLRKILMVNKNFNLYYRIV